MSCLRISEAKNSSFPLLHIQSKKTCAIQCALCLITLIGSTLSILAIVSYVPPYAGYWGGGSAIASLIAMAIIHVSRGTVPATRKRVDSTALEEANTILGSNASNTVAAVPVRSSIEELPRDTSTHIFSYLDPESLARVGRTCRTLSTIAKQDQLWERHCKNHFIPITDSSSNIPNKWKTAFQDVKYWALRLKFIEPIRKVFNPTEKICSVLVKKDKIFVGVHQAIQVWDRNLTERIHTVKVSIDSPDRFKIVGDTLFCVDLDEFSSKEPLLVQLNLKTFEVHGLCKKQPISFHLKDWDKSLGIKKLIEFSNSHAFVNHKDGSISIWDIGLGYGSYDDIDEDTNYDDFLNFTTNELTQDVYEVRKKIAPSLIEYQSMVKNRKVLTGHTATINQLLVFENYLFSSSEDKTIKQWDITNYECIKTIHTKFSRGVDYFTVNSSYIFGYVFEGSNTHFKLWELTNGEYLQSFTLNIKIDRCCIKGNLLLFTHKNTLHIYDIYKSEEIKAFQISEEDKDISILQIEDNQLIYQFDNSIFII